jgi:hypothetical protein
MSHPGTAKLYMLPDMIIIGAMKCGTTSLFRYLAEHPDFFPPITKEIHFFDSKYNQGLDWYRRRFPTKVRKLACRLRGRRIITGEASPYYMFHPHAMRRIASVLPKVKLIVLLRNPVDRAYSHYHYEVKHGREQLTFEQALDAEPVRLEGELEKMLHDERYFSVHYGRHAYLRRGIYVEQLKACRVYFQEEQFFVVDSAEMLVDLQGVYDQVCAFLQLAPHKIKNAKTHNRGVYQEPMPADLRKRLIDYFAPHNQALYDYLGMQFEWDR